MISVRITTWESVPAAMARRPVKCSSGCTCPRRGSTGLILLYGDTNSTLAGAFVGAKMGIALVHIEAVSVATALPWRRRASVW